MADARKRRQARKRGEADKSAGQRKRPDEGLPSDKHNLIAALNHKHRRQLLRTLHGCDDPLSPVNLSGRLSVALSNVSYHVTILRRCGAIALVDKRQARGAIEHFYISKVAGNPAVKEMLDDTEAGDEGEV